MAGCIRSMKNLLKRLAAASLLASSTACADPPEFPVVSVPLFSSCVDSARKMETYIEQQNRKYNRAMVLRVVQFDSRHTAHSNVVGYMSLEARWEASPGRGDPAKLLQSYADEFMASCRTLNSAFIKSDEVNLPRARRLIENAGHESLQSPEIEVVLTDTGARLLYHKQSYVAPWDKN